jgi:hypothetical protein
MRTGRVSLEYFYSRLRQGPLSLRRVQVDMITIVDHLGRNIPVPILFCSAWTVNLFHLVCWSGHVFWRARYLIISSMDTAKTARENVSWSGAIIKSSVPTIARQSIDWKLGALLSQE